MKFYIKSLGCKTNAIEGQIIAENLINAGFVQCADKKEADICIVNSCTVTHHADNQTLYLIKQLRKDNPKAKIILCGCSAQTLDLKDIDADLILGNNEKLDIVSFLDKKGIKVQKIFDIKEFNNKFLNKTSSTRPPVKIQDGCNNRCSYCLIPYARGNSRSNSIENIVEQIKIHAQNNRKEIVLTGIHIGQWGLDKGKKLTDLLYEIEKTNIVRYRLGSLYVDEIDDELFNFLKASKKFCPHFHLSLQSLSNKILKSMNRSYTKEFALKKIKEIQNNFDLPYIGCDIITGFPDENYEDFLETKNALIEANVSYIHSFPYSKRKGTKACEFKNQVLEHIKKERTKELIVLCEKLHKNFLELNKNKTKTILWEKKGKNGLYSGVSENYIKVYKKSDKNIQNTIETVNLSEFSELF